MSRTAKVLEHTPFPHWMKTLDGLEKKHGVFRVVRFAAASSTGFLVNEAIVVMGVLVLYRTIKVPSFSQSGLNILGLDALALGIGDTVAFVINERVTVKGLGEEKRKGRLRWSIRWSEYQLTSLLGNAMVVGIQLSLFATTSLSPVFGNVVGALVSYPVTYVVSMHYVWRVRAFNKEPPESDALD